MAALIPHRRAEVKPLEFSDCEGYMHTSSETHQPEVVHGEADYRRYRRKGQTGADAGGFQRPAEGRQGRDDKRIRAALPTIQHILGRAAGSS